jgi:hypothetical protein
MQLLRVAEYDTPDRKAAQPPPPSGRDETIFPRHILKREGSLLIPAWAARGSGEFDD